MNEIQNKINSIQKLLKELENSNPNEIKISENNFIHKYHQLQSQYQQNKNNQTVMIIIQKELNEIQQ